MWHCAKAAQIFGKRIREQPGCYTNQHQQTKSCNHHKSLWSAQIAGKLGSALRFGKRAFYDQIDMPVAEAYDFTGEVMVRNMLDRDTEEGIAAFLEKRDPAWRQ